MSKGNAMRWSGLAAIVGGLLLIPGTIMAEQPSWASLNTLAWLLIVFGMMGIFAFQVEESGLAGFLGFVLFVAGAVFLLGTGQFAGVDSTTIAELLGLVGLVLLGIGTLIARKFPRWVPWLWFATIILAVPADFVPALANVLAVASAVAVALGIAGAGYHLFTRGPAAM
jgi:drug/metabolite transporter (DMT)-like permease